MYEFMDRKELGITFVGCRAHGRHRFTEAVKVSPKEKIAYQVLTRIAAIYHQDNDLAALSPEQSVKQR